MGREDEVAQLAYSMERLSNHPLARAINRYGKREQLPVLHLDRFESVTGMGIQADLDGHPCRLGRREWLEGEFPEGLEVESASEPGISEVWLVRDGLVGRVTLRDDIRSEAGAVLSGLKGEGLETVVLTGDRKVAADRLKTVLEVAEIRSELKPDGKRG